MISVASSQCSLSSRRTMVVTYTAHFCRCPSLFLHKVSVGRLLPKTVEAFKRTHHTFVPHCPRGLAHAIQGQLNFAYVALQQPTLDGKAEMYLRPNCPLRCGSGVSVVRYCENCNALNLLSASLTLFVSQGISIFACARLNIYAARLSTILIYSVQRDNQSIRCRQHTGPPVCRFCFFRLQFILP